MAIGGPSLLGRGRGRHRPELVTSTTVQTMTFPFGPKRKGCVFVGSGGRIAAHGLARAAGTPRLGTTTQRFACCATGGYICRSSFGPSFTFYIDTCSLVAFSTWSGAGFLYAALQGFWLRLIVDWKTVELRQARLTGEGLLQFAEAMLRSKSGSVKEIVVGRGSQAENAD